MRIFTIATIALIVAVTGVLRIVEHDSKRSSHPSHAARAATPVPALPVVDLGPEYVPLDPTGLPHEEPAPPPAPEPVAIEAPSVRASSPSSSGGCDGDVDCFLACTRAHESDTAGGYGAVSPGGTYRGAYQFLPSTWAAAVAGAGHEEWAGTPVDQVPPDVQDAAAAHLYSVSGNRPWGGRC